MNYSQKLLPHQTDFFYLAGLLPPSNPGYVPVLFSNQQKQKICIQNINPIRIVDILLLRKPLYLSMYILYISIGIKKDSPNSFEKRSLLKFCEALQISAECEHEITVRERKNAWRNAYRHTSKQVVLPPPGAPFAQMHSPATLLRNKDTRGLLVVQLRTEPHLSGMVSSKTASLVFQLVRRELKEQRRLLERELCKQREHLIGIINSVLAAEPSCLQSASDARAKCIIPDGAPEPRVVLVPLQTAQNVIPSSSQPIDVYAETKSSPAPTRPGTSERQCSPVVNCPSAGHSVMPKRPALTATRRSPVPSPNVTPERLCSLALESSTTKAPNECARMNLTAKLKGPGNCKRRRRTPLTEEERRIYNAKASERMRRSRERKRQLRQLAQGVSSAASMRKRKVIGKTFGQIF